MAPKKKEKEDNPLVCSVCGSDQVQVVMWIRPNTDEIVDPFGDPNDEENCWCDICEEHHELWTKEEYDNTTNSANDVNEE